MDSIHLYGNQCCVSQGGTGKFVKVDDQFSFTQVAAAESVPAVHPVAGSGVTDASYLPHQLLRDSSHGYECLTNVEIIPEICEDNFLQEYAVKCGYQLTEVFLSTMDRLKVNFIERVNLILSDLYLSFNFLKESEYNYKCVMTTMNKICFSFSKKVYDLVPKCVDILQSDIVPVAIKIIFDSSVIDGSSVRKLTHPEMEQLFVHLINTLEKLIMVEAMKHWCDFCCENKSILSLVPDIDYSDPFACSYPCEVISAPKVDRSAAFVLKFGEYISFITIAKIDDVSSGFISKCANELKRIVCSKCTYICIYSSDASADIRGFGNELGNLISNEFDKKINEEMLKDSFSNCLNEVMFSNDQVVKSEDMERRKLSVINLIISDIYESLVCFVRDDLSDVIKISYSQIMFSKRGTSKGMRGSCIIERRWGAKLHPEDSYSILSLRRKFYCKAKDIVKSKFCTMLKEKHEFSDGTVVSKVGWKKISKKLFPIAQESVRFLIISEHLEVHKILSNARVVGDISVLDGSCVDVREISSEEKNNVLKRAIASISHQTKDLFRRVWIYLIKDQTLGRHEENVDCTSLPISEDGNSLVGTSLVKSEPSMPQFIPMELNHYSLRINEDKIVSRWGLNLHPDDDKLILFLRRRFSEAVRNNLRVLFSDMLEREYVLPSGKVLRKCYWNFVSRELIPIAIESIKSIVEDQYKELDSVLSKARVVDVDKNNASYCIVRKVTDNEKDSLAVRAKKITDGGLVFSIRLSWLDVIKTSINTGYGYRERHGDIDGVATDGSWGVKLRYDDNIAILSIRRKFSREIRERVGNKFREMIRNKYKFDDDTVIGKFSWFRVSKKIFPIAKEEIKHLIKDENKELEAVVSKSHVLLDAGDDRKITDEEKYIILENIGKLVDKRLKALFGRIWSATVSSLSHDYDCTGDYNTEDESYKVGCVDNVSSPSLDIKNIEDSDQVSDNKLEVNLCHEDDVAILSIRRRFSSEMIRHVSDKFFEMLKNRHKFDDGTVVDILPWKKISKNMIFVARKEIKPILERERIKIDEMLSESRVEILESDGFSSVARELTPKEKSVTLECIMSSVYTQSLSIFSRVWADVLKLSEGKFLRKNTDLNMGAGTSGIEGESVIELRCDDNVAIFNIKKKYLSKFSLVINNKFSEMIKNRHRFDDGTIIRRVDWFRVHRKLFPVVEEEVKHIIEAENKELEGVISEARVVVDAGIDRELTNEEKSSVLETAIKLVAVELKNLCGKVWSDVLFTLGNTTVNAVGCVKEGAEHDWGSVPRYEDLRYEDDSAILNARRNFSAEMSKCVRDKFTKMLEGMHRFSDGTVIGKFPWKDISQNMLPIAKEEVEPIIKKERIEINEILLKSRVIVSAPDGSRSIARELTAEERCRILKGIMRCVYRQVVYGFSRLWRLVLESQEEKSPERDTNTKVSIKKSSVASLEEICGVKLRYSDSTAIFNIRREYSSKVALAISNKFRKMLRSGYVFDDNSVLGGFAWFRVSRKLFPIAMKEVEPILSAESKELEVVISGARDSTTDRELTNEEKCIVLKKLVKFVDKGLKALSGRVWAHLLSASGYGHGYAGKNFGAVSGDFLPLDNTREDSSFADDVCDVKLRCEDDVAILNVRRKFSSEISRCIRNKFIEMIRDKYEFGDGTVIGKFPWKKVSRNVLPIARIEVSPIIERERAEINDLLLRSRVVVSVPGNSLCVEVRELTPEEIHSTLEIIMKSVYRQETYSFSKSWVAILKLQGENDGAVSSICDDELKMVELSDNCSSSLCLLDLRGSDTEELDNIRLEFVGNLGTIIGESFSSLSSDVGALSPSRLECVVSTVAERGRVLFKEGGFLDRLELLLSGAQVDVPFGNGRALTDMERKYISRLFMNGIDSDRDYLIKKRVGALVGAHATIFGSRVKDGGEVCNL
ncbi:hypothetical protein [Candidatus Ichthyocystis hellenicum]|uniref:hypothetical protein n=1 Tax=Candidatus Ichthyocystis hellenicum TaxID=1561003 RepID=UPI000AC0AA82|nr:hypothetical protein [Candidatus Ichthyocystis hellenicum]